MKKMMEQMKMNDFKNHLNALEKSFEGMQRRASDLQSKLDDFNKDDEIAKLREELEETRVNSLHVMSDSEKEKWDNFRKRHYAKCMGNTTITLEGTGLGWGIKLTCTKCNRCEDITDTSNW